MQWAHLAKDNKNTAVSKHTLLSLLKSDVVQITIQAADYWNMHMKVLKEFVYNALNLTY